MSDKTNASQRGKADSEREGEHDRRKKSKQPHPDAKRPPYRAVCDECGWMGRERRWVIRCRLDIILHTFWSPGSIMTHYNQSWVI